MPQPTVAAVERQVKDHGLSIQVKVKSNGVCEVTLKDSYNGNIFIADSGDHTDESRYEVALFIAAQRMLDYWYRVGGPASLAHRKRPALGEESM